MSVIARQSTARTVIVGPILDADGVAVTGAAVGDLKISKNGAAPAALNASAILTHRNTGHYSLALTASDLDTVGQAEVVIDKTTDAMPQKVITVVEEAVYDVLYASGAVGPATAWTTALTEAYRATGAEGTPAQLLYEILQHLGEFSISGTTKTLKKLDGTTTAKTSTLNSATDPSSITEAT